MPKMNETELRVISRGYSIWKSRESETKKDITIDDIVEGTGASIGTVRKFVAVADADVSGAAIVGAVKIANFFGVPLSGPDGLLDY
jgi:adenine/guanine phosphoribosyltransferase-like PRPP-binding protein